MPIGNRLVQSLAVVTPTDDVNDDAYGQPIRGEPTVAVVKGLIQPKSARLRGQEIEASHGAGSLVGDHTVYLLPQTLSGAAYIRHDPDDGDRYQIVGIRRYDFGRNQHLEVDTVRVVAATIEAAAS
jgi:hypothetical protein